MIYLAPLVTTLRMDGVCICTILRSVINEVEKDPIFFFGTRFVMCDLVDEVS
jgi:hypothetical protein